MSGMGRYFLNKQRIDHEMCESSGIDQGPEGKTLSKSTGIRAVKIMHNNRVPLFIHPHNSLHNYLGADYNTNW